MRHLNTATAASKARLQTQAISSRDNPWLKKFRAALQQGQKPDGLIGVEGPHLIQETFRSSLDITALLVSSSGDRHLRRFAPWLNALHARTHLQLLRTSDRLFATVAATETPQGVAALLHPPVFQFDDLLRGPRQEFTPAQAPLVIVLVAVQDPGNVGTIFRSAEAFGATGVVSAQGTADPWSPKALRASAGAALRMPAITHVALPVVLAQLRISGVQILAAHSDFDFAAGPNTGSRDNLLAASLPNRSPEGASIAAQADLRAPTALLIGNEGAGLPEEVVRSADGTISIPLASGVESLNAAIAASVLLYEAARQRRGRN